jgi:hypothetical protein
MIGAMADLLRVLVYGSIDAGVCDFVRLGVYRDLLAAHGVELRTWGDFNDYLVQVPPAYADRLDDAVRDGVATLDLSPIDWADVLVFRRWNGTVYACDNCDYAAPDSATLIRHTAATGHAPVVRDRIIRPLLASIERERAVLRGRAMVYELDDDLLSPQPWLGFYGRIGGDLDLIERLARTADLVTVTTPILAARMRRYNAAVRVIRNAVVPEWYEAPGSGAEPRPLSMLYYGVRARLRDYAICREAVDQTARATGAHRIWLGADEADVRSAVDEAIPYEKDVRGFIRKLVSARPAIGLAPIGEDAFSRSHSELHWLEYSLAGAATVASRSMGGGPYDVIRDGEDGLLARNKVEWREQLRRLAASAQLRDDLAGRARERVLAEYDARQRAAEWADAFRWAADHAGRGALGGAALRRGGPLASDREAAVVAEAQAGLARRQIVRARRLLEARRLDELRGGSDVCWSEDAAAEHKPLVTVRIATYDREAIVVKRAIESALTQTYENLEILVVGDGATPRTVEAVRSMADRRLRFINLPERGHYPADPERRWMVAGSVPMNYARGVARGSWIAPLDDDDEFTPDHVELLLSIASEHRLEFVYGLAEAEMANGSWGLVGTWPPVQGGICHGSILYSAVLDFIGYDEESWRDGEPTDWNRWRRMVEAGVRMGRVESVVYRHYAEARHRPQPEVVQTNPGCELLEARS